MKLCLCLCSKKWGRAGCDHTREFEIDTNIRQWACSLPLAVQLKQMGVDLRPCSQPVRLSYNTSAALVKLEVSWIATSKQHAVLGVWAETFLCDTRCVNPKVTLDPGETSPVGRSATYLPSLSAAAARYTSNACFQTRAGSVNRGGKMVFTQLVQEFTPGDKTQ